MDRIAICLMIYGARSDQIIMLFNKVAVVLIHDWGAKVGLQELTTLRVPYE